MATPSDQLEAMRRLSENWDGYGGASPKPGIIDLAHEFVKLLEAMLAKSAEDRPALHVSPTRVGGILIEWEDQTKEHELELNPDSSIGFLHLEKATGHIVTRKFSSRPELAIDPGLLQELRHLLAA
ncbi:MAG TPA: hypothetical protein VFA18_00355 [Gemmataceae bacterium]|nr:hypothetical protein [Gemmataceae bacterium]